MTPLECGIIFHGIPEGAISRKVGLIWGIPVRYVYMLESPPGGGDLLPRESAHAHNFFIHYGVESGVLGLLAALGIFLFRAHHTLANSALNVARLTGSAASLDAAFRFFDETADLVPNAWPLYDQLAATYLT